MLATLAPIGIGDLLAFAADPPRVGRQLAFANARLMTGDKQVARASAVFAVVQD